MTDSMVRPELRQRPQRLHQVDLFRILTFACVIAVHVLSGTTLGDNTPSNALQLLLHFTREAFFTLTGFVLVYQYSRRPLRLGPFWRRRFLLIGLPYLVWTVVYWAVPLIEAGHLEPADLGVLGLDLVEGTASYHLYFLLVTMQVYLLLPLLMRLLRATAGHHRWVLAVSGALQIVVAWLLTNPPVTTGPLGDLLAHGYATVVAYQFYSVLGAVVALHFSAVHDWVRRHPALIAGTGIAAGLAVLVIYRLRVGAGLPAYVAAGVFQPYAPVWYVAFIVVLYAVSSAWAARRRPDGPVDRAIAYGSDRSFGIFLSHPLVLAFLVGAPAQWLGVNVGQPWASLVVYLATVAAAVALTELLRRSPASLVTTGRPRIRAIPEQES